MQRCCHVLRVGQCLLTAPGSAVFAGMHGDKSIDLGRNIRFFGDGFQMLTLPQMAAMHAFHDQTATGKLNAVIVPTSPTGCHCSYMRCCGRSECIVLP